MNNEPLKLIRKEISFYPIFPYSNLKDYYNLNRLISYHINKVLIFCLYNHYNINNKGITMRKIVLIAFASLPLFADFFPQTVETSVSSVEKKSVVLTSAFPINGMSGVVIHHFGDNLDAITSRIVQKSSNNTVLLRGSIVHHDELPTIKTHVGAGDKVIGGYLYNNVLLLAPDANTYAKITSSYGKNWIHPDLFALFLSKEGDTQPTKKNLAHFAKAYQVGLVYIVGNGAAKLLDPISGQIVGRQSVSGLPTKGESPFFMRFDKIDTGWFGSSTKGNYYQLMDQI